MKLYLSEKEYIDTNEVFDLSLPIQAGEHNLRAWYVDPPRMEPVRAHGFIGSVKEGGAVNFRNVFFNPHGHGTHTECLGHITEEVYSVNECIHDYFFLAELVSVTPQRIWNEEMSEEDDVISAEQLRSKIRSMKVDALIIRTLPNSANKKVKNYSASNPPYLSIDCLAIMNELEVKHLLIDLPSVDRESDNGELAFHHGFWEVPQLNRKDRTITELIYVADVVEDGIYLMNLQVAPFVNDAAPSRPVLYRINK